MDRSDMATIGDICKELRAASARQRLGDFTSRDRLWLVTMPDGSQEAMTDYNWEVTSVTKKLSEEFDIRYSGNAYYWVYELPNRGCAVEYIEDRRTL